MPGLAGTFWGHRHRVWWEKMGEGVLLQTMARLVAHHLKSKAPELGLTASGWLFVVLSLCKMRLDWTFTLLAGSS